MFISRLARSGGPPAPRRHILSLTASLVGLVLVLALQVLTTAHARSVYDEGALRDKAQHSQLASNRHQNGGAGGAPANGGPAKLTQAANFNGNHNRCQQGWMWVNNKCWVTTQSRRDFTHAMDLCKRMYNSTLPTIHSEEENEFLRNNIDLVNSPIWLFARHNHQYNKTRWLDKSAVDYTRWDDGQPSDKASLVCIKTEDSWYMKKATPTDGQTECVSFWEDAKWATSVGCQVLLPVVCEKKLTPVSRLSDGPNGSLSQFEQMAGITAAGSPSAPVGWPVGLALALAGGLVAAKLAV